MHPSAIRAGIVWPHRRLFLAAACFFSTLLVVTLLPAVAPGAGLSFTAPSRYPTGDFPCAIAAGDINHNGHLALVTANRVGDSVTVYLGASNGRFGSKKTFGVGSGPTDVQLADVNADGNLDILTANGGGSSVSVLLGDGAEGFAPKADFATAQTPCALAVADLDGDGHLDLAVVHNNVSTAGISLLYGDGTGSFGAPVVVTRPDYYRDVVATDLDHDGRTDLVVILTVDMSPRLGVLLGEAGGLAPMQLYATYLEPWWIAVGAMNDDSFPDLAIVEGLDGDGDLQVFLGDGLGSFAPLDRYGYKTQSQLFGLALADFDKDGHSDAATSMGKDVVVLRGSSTGEASSRHAFPVGAPSQAVLAGLFNRDDLPDLAIVDPIRGTLGVLLNGPRLRPVIDGISPARGSAGEVITIRGHHFGALRGSGTVRFGGRKASGYVYWSGTKVRAKVPAGVAAGRIEVRIKTVAGFSPPRSFLLR